MEKVIAIYREVNNPVTGFNQSLAAKTFTDRRSANNTGNGFNLVETTEDLAGINLPSGELVKLHNLYAKKPVNKFSDKATAVKRTFGVLSDLPTSNKPVSNVEKEMELYREKVPSFGPKVSKPRGAFGGKKIKCLVNTNPRKEGTRNNFSLFLGHGTISYEEFVKLAEGHGSTKGGCREDLAHDIKKGRVELIDA